AVTGLAVGVEAQVPDLSCVAARTLEPLSAADDAGTDTDVAGDVDEVTDADAGAALVLCDGTEVRVVAQGDGHVQPEGGQHDPAEGDVVPVQVGRQPNEPVAAPDHAGDADADADQGGGGGGVGDDLAHQAGHGRADLPGLAA